MHLRAYNLAGLLFKSLVVMTKAGRNFFHYPFSMSLPTPKAATILGSIPASFDTLEAVTVVPYCHVVLLTPTHGTTIRKKTFVHVTMRKARLREKKGT